MPNFTWKGRTREGRVQEGVLVAENKDAVITSLRKQQIIVTGDGHKIITLWPCEELMVLDPR